jgi:hypothetical protein
MLEALISFHQSWGPIASAICGIVGLWGLLMGRREAAPPSFYWGLGVAILSMIAQVVIGVVALSSQDPGDQHVFYGILVAVTLAFAYIYRAQFRKRPTLAYGLLLLFMMGLGIRSITTVGVNF